MIENKNLMIIKEQSKYIRSKSKPIKINDIEFKILERKKIPKTKNSENQKVQKKIKKD